MVFVHQQEDLPAFYRSVNHCGWYEMGKAYALYPTEDE